MFKVIITKNGIETHSQSFLTSIKANDWIQLCGNKPSHPWGRPAGWFKLAGENKIEFMGFRDIKPEEILESRITEDGEEVRLNSEYTIQIIDLDQDVNTLTEAKRYCRKRLKDMVSDEISDQYPWEEMGFMLIIAMNRHLAGNNMTIAYNNMTTFITGILAKGSTAKTAINNATCMVELRLVEYNGVQLLKGFFVN